ncbi:hypothetical protein [Erwinia psidii]|uniref:hypothetical protein n=1 Tax=Erwinia psidii TaxID=69224 RepID=UPI001F2D5C7C|nr:hypothetical protein [Erwinia psidii]
MKNPELSVNFQHEVNLVEFIIQSKNIDELSRRLCESHFNDLYLKNEFGHKDIRSIIEQLTAVSLSLAVTFSQHMQAVNVLKMSSISSLKHTGLIASATTSVKGASLNSRVCLEANAELLTRNCPCVSYFAEATHLIFTGLVGTKNSIVFCHKNDLHIEKEETIETWGMTGNRIERVEFSVQKKSCYIIDDHNLNLSNNVLAFYAHLYWGISWAAMFNRALHYVRRTVKEYKFYHYEKMQQVINIDLINSCLIERLEHHFPALNKEKITDVLEQHIHNNSAKIIIAENVCSGMKIMLDILGFKEGYQKREENNWFQQAYTDLLSAPLMFNNADLNKINIETLQILKKFKRDKND